MHKQIWFGLRGLRGRRTIKPPVQTSPSSTSGRILFRLFGPRGLRGRCTIKPPVAIRLEASSFCNLRCPLCPTTTGDVHRGAVGGGFLRFEDFRKLLDDNPGLQHIELSNYGEIFLNPALLSVLELAHERGVTLSAVNGVNLNKIRPEVLEGLVKYQFRQLVCSIDGASQETYSIYRVRGKFANVINNIRKINELKQLYSSPFPELSWKFVVFGHNEHEVAVAREMARELGITFFTALNWDPNYSPVRDPEAVRAATNDAIVSRDEFEELHGHSRDLWFCSQLWDTADQLGRQGARLLCQSLGRFRWQCLPRRIDGERQHRANPVCASDVAWPRAAACRAAAAATAELGSATRPCLC